MRLCGLAGAFGGFRRVLRGFEGILGVGKAVGLEGSVLRVFGRRSLPGNWEDEEDVVGVSNSGEKRERGRRRLPVAG